MYQLKDIATYLTKRERLLLLAVMAGAVLLIFLGVWIESKITEGLEQKARMYQTATRVENDNQLNYSIDTQQGNVWANVTVKPVDLVKFSEMDKSFAKVKKTEERYTQKERTVCETHYRTETRTETEYDSEGVPYTVTVTEEVPYEECHQETYYEWDYVQHWDKSAKQIDMAGRKYPIDMFSLKMSSIDAKDIIKGETGKYARVEAKTLIDFNLFDSDDVGDIRYSYQVLELPKSGTVLLNVSNGVRDAEHNKVTLRTVSAEKATKDAQNASQIASTIFRVFWGLLVLAELIVLGYAASQYEN